MKYLYRISNGSRVRERLKTKQESLSNFIGHFGTEDLILIADKMNKTELSYVPCKKIFINKGSNFGSWKLALDYALDLKEDIYFVEDDYWHLENSLKVLKEGLEIADIVSLYDHPDKYGNDVYKKSYKSELFYTKSCYWRSVQSTTMTFGIRQKALIECEHIMRKDGGGLSNDYEIFTELTTVYAKRLISAIPSYATHAETKYIAPNFNI